MHHIFIDENFIEENAGKILIEKKTDIENFNHLVKVLHVKTGENVLCSVIPFNFTYDYRTKICAITDDKLILDIEEKTNANEMPININLYQGLPKSDKLEFIIEKAVELGVHSITPVINEFSVAKIDDKKIISKLDRYNKISRSAAEQSKRNIIPEVKRPIKYEDMINDIDCDKSILFYENADGISETRMFLKNLQNEINKVKMINSTDKLSINIIIGPEGGFSNKEIEIAKNVNIKILSLGDRILRTETAAITALSILMYEFA